MDSSVTIGILVAMGILLIIFLVIRELVCWYWKINRVVELLESIDNKINGMSKRHEA